MFGLGTIELLIILALIAVPVIVVLVVLGVLRRGRGTSRPSV